MYRKIYSHANSIRVMMMMMMVIDMTCLKYQEVVLYLQPLNTLAWQIRKLYIILVYYLPKPLFLYVLMVLLSIVGL